MLFSLFAYLRQFGVLMGLSDSRSRILTLDGARYSITERKGGIGCVRGLLFPL
jgi:hypothetical protein